MNFWKNRLKRMFKVLNYRECYLLMKMGFDSLNEDQIQIMFGSDGYNEIKKQFKKIEEDC